MKVSVLQTILHAVVIRRKKLIDFRLEYTAIYYITHNTVDFFLCFLCKEMINKKQPATTQPLSINAILHGQRWIERLKKLLLHFFMFLSFFLIIKSIKIIDRAFNSRLYKLRLETRASEYVSERARDKDRKGIFFERFE